MKAISSLPYTQLALQLNGYVYRNDVQILVLTLKAFKDEDDD